MIGLIRIILWLGKRDWGLILLACSYVVLGLSGASREMA